MSNENLMLKETNRSYSSEEERLINKIYADAAMTRLRSAAETSSPSRMAVADETEIFEAQKALMSTLYKLQ